MNLKSIVWFIKAISYFVLLRSIGNILHDLAAKYDHKLSIAELRHFEKTSQKREKPGLMSTSSRIVSHFTFFPDLFHSPCLSNTSPKDVKAIRKRLLRSAIEKRSKELKRLENEKDKISNKLQHILNSLDFYLLRHALQSNIHKYHPRWWKHMPRNFGI